MNCTHGNELDSVSGKCKSCEVVTGMENIECAVGEYTNKKVVWSPRAIKYIAIFCTLIPGLVLFSMNYARLEHPKKKTRILALIGITSLFFLVAILTPANPIINYLFLVANIGIAIYFSNDQKVMFENHLQKGGKKASIVIPLVLSIIFCVCILVLLILAENELQKQSIL